VIARVLLSAPRLLLLDGADCFLRQIEGLKAAILCQLRSLHHEFGIPMFTSRTTQQKRSQLAKRC
jgi:ABC-type molybdate transport system ATPase subunit